MVWLVHGDNRSGDGQGAAIRQGQTPRDQQRGSAVRHRSPWRWGQERGPDALSQTVRPVQEPMGPRGVKSGSLSRTIELEPFLSPWPRQCHRAKSLGPFPWDAGPHYRDTRRGWHRAYCHLVVDNCLAGSVKVKIKSCCEAKLTLLAHRTSGSFLPLCHILSLFLRLSLTICFSLRSIKSSFSLSLDIDNVS